MTFIDTVYCDSSSYVINMTDLILGVEGIKIYELITEASDSRVTGYQPSSEYTAGLSISDTLINNTYEYQTVEYRFIARIKDDRPGMEGNYCENGTDTTIVIYLNPTPRIAVNTIDDDTLYCNEEAVRFFITTLTPSSNVIGTTAYDLDPIYDAGNISGVSSGPDNPIEDFIDIIVNNHNDSVKVIEYTFKPRILDIRPDGKDCDYGINTTIRIYVAATLNDSLESAKVWIGGHDLRCNYAQNSVKGGHYAGADSAGINLYRWGGFGEYLGNDYEYYWKDSLGSIQGDTIADSLSAGWYFVTIEDSEECRISDSLQLTEPPLFDGAIDSVSRDLCGGTDATIYTSVGGGVPVYDFTWTKFLDPGFERKDQSPGGLSPGAYNLVTLDANGCDFSEDTAFYNPVGIAAIIDDSDFGYYDIACNGDSNGFIEVVFAIGGFGNWEDYRYEWRTAPEDLDPFVTNIRIDNVPAGSYYLTIYDSLDCVTQISQPYILKQPDSLIIDETISLYGGRYNVQCFDSLNGYILIDDNEGPIGREDRIHNYTWSTKDGIITNPNNMNQEYLPAGTYYLYIHDSLPGSNYKCELRDTFTLVPPEPLILQDTSFSDYRGVNISCFDALDGWIDVTAGGGFYHAPDYYTYNWIHLDGLIPPQTDNLITELPAGEYQLTIGDSLGCTRIDILLRTARYA